MEVLNIWTETVGGVTTINTIACIVGSIFLIISLILMLDSIFDITWEAPPLGVSVVIAILAALLLAGGIYGNNIPRQTYEYSQVIFTENQDINVLLDEYSIEEKDGKIFTLKRLIEEE